VQGEGAPMREPMETQTMFSMKTRLMAAVAVGALLASAPAHAQQAQSDTQAIRQQIEQMRRDYEARIRDLEKRLGKAETDAKSAKDAAAQSQQTAAMAQATAKTAQQQAQTAQQTASAPPSSTAPAQNDFNPGISAVLNGNYNALSRDSTNAKVPGFALGDEANDKKRGFNIGESEITLNANVDQAMFANLTVSFDQENNASVEEAFVQSTSLPYGFTAKGGRFFSGIGYLNEKHAHDWDFIDAPLPYRVMLNKQYGDDGLQLRWLAPTDMFVEFGAEMFRGDAFPSGNASRAGNGARSAFVHVGDDINDSSSWLAGLSYLGTSANNRVTGSDTFDGRDDLGIGSLVYKWSPGGNPVNQNLILSGEYFRRKERGTFNEFALNTWQSGWYTQAVYQFMPQWRAGVRYDQVSASSLGSEFAGTTLDSQGRTPDRWTALLEYDTSEFGRFRLQYNRDNTDLKTDDQLLFQYTVIIGPHGAHRF
jgi:hypothetical protein